MLVDNLGLAKLIIESIGVSFGCFVSITCLLGYFLVLPRVRFFVERLFQRFMVSGWIAAFWGLLFELLAFGLLIFCNALMIQYFIHVFIELNM